MQTRSSPVREHLPPHPSSVGVARRLVRGVAAANGEDLPADLVDNAELLASELVSNAVMHAGTAVDVEVSIDGPASLLVSVADGSRRVPARRRYGTSAATGRGLRLLDRISDEWGVSPRANGKAVWFRVTGAHHRQAVTSPSTAEGGDGPLREVVTVELLQLPLVLHARWQQHAEALLREYLLAALGGEDDVDAQLQRHAECSDAVALLAEAIANAAQHRAPGGDQEASWSDEVVVSVPKQAVSHFATLDQTLTDALVEAESDQLLTDPTDYELRRFRSWLCEQVADQARGLPATPWHSDQD